jgi:PEGA domain
LSWRVGRFGGAWLLRVAVLGALVFPPPAAGQEAVAPKSAAVVQATFEQIVALRLDGKYDQAVTMLNDVITSYTKSDEILRRAYNHLVTVYVQNDDEEGARAAGRAALESFPDLTADELEFPGRVNDVYNQLRKEMFGSFVISQPKECRVYLNGTYMGDTPLILSLVRVGEYDLTVTKSGYKDYISRIEIQPELTRDLSGLALDRDRAWWWWPAWIGGAAVTAVAVAVGVSGGDEGTPPEPQPLAAPPPPPAN